MSTHADEKLKQAIVDTMPIRTKREYEQMKAMLHNHAPFSYAGGLYKVVWLRIRTADGVGEAGIEVAKRRK